MKILSNRRNPRIPIGLGDSYGDLKVQKWGFAILAPILFICAPCVLELRLCIHRRVIWLNGDLKLPIEKRL